MCIGAKMVRGNWRVVILNLNNMKTFESSIKMDTSLAEPTLVDYVLKILAWFLITIFLLKMFK